MSYTGLIADADHSQPGSEKLFNQVVLFVVECRPAEVRHGRGMHHDFIVSFLNKRALTGVPDAITDHVHGRLEIEFFPVGGVRSPILDAGLAVGVRQQFEAVSTLRAKSSTGDKRIGISFDRDEFSILVIHELAATDSTIGTDRPRDVRTLMPGPKIAGSRAHRSETRAITPPQDQANELPAQQF